MRKKPLRELAASGWDLRAAVRSRRGWTMYYTHPEVSSEWVTLAVAKALERRRCRVLKNLTRKKEVDDNAPHVTNRSGR